MTKITADHLACQGQAAFVTATHTLRGKSGKESPGDKSFIPAKGIKLTPLSTHANSSSTLNFTNAQRVQRRGQPVDHPLMRRVEPRHRARILRASPHFPFVFFGDRTRGEVVDRLHAARVGRCIRQQVAPADFLVGRQVEGARIVVAGVVGLFAGEGDDDDALEPVARHSFVTRESRVRWARCLAGAREDGDVLGGLGFERGEEYGRAADSGRPDRERRPAVGFAFLKEGYACVAVADLGPRGRGEAYPAILVSKRTSTTSTSCIESTTCGRRDV